MNHLMILQQKRQSKKTLSPYRVVWLLLLFLSGSITTFAQSTVTGVVKNAEGDPLQDASIEIVQLKKSTASDKNGVFTFFKVPIGNYEFKVSYAGYMATITEVAVKADMPELVFILEKDLKYLEDVVVIGYGNQKRSDVTGAVSKANLAQQKQSPNGNVMSSLRGTVPGLTIGQVTTAGSSPSLMIRGRNSISGITSPLIVLDGLIYRGNITSINPADIATIDILKDGSAAAVYGSQASNGVIMITTKSGRGSQEKITIDYNGSYSIQEMTNKDMRPLNGAQFLEKIGNWYLSESRNPNDMTQMNPQWDPSVKLSVLEAEIYKKGLEANWWKLLTNEAPYIQNHNIGISGQSKKIRFYLGYGYFDQNNLIKNDNYTRNSIRINMEVKALDWLTVGAQTGLTINNYSGVSPNFSDLMYLRPYTYPFDSVTGKQLVLYPQSTNPTHLEVLQRSRDSDKNLNLIGNFYASVNIPYIKGLNYRVNFGNNYIYSNRFNYNAPNVEATAYKRYMTDYFLTLDNILTYKRDFGRHGIDLTLLYGSEINKHDGTQTTAGGIINGVLGYERLDVGDPTRLTVSNDLGILPWKEQAQYQMARISYSFNKKYILTGTIRRDGFSGFSERNKTAVFPSAAFAWRLIEEDFIKPIKQINDLKLRISYGSTGNRTVGRYQTLAQINTGLGNGYLYGTTGTAQSGSFLGQLPNPDLKWETTNSFNTGIDFALFENRLSGSMEFYFSKSKNLLNSRGTPSITGFNSFLINIGQVQNSGQEISLNGVPVANKDFRWEAGVNFFRNRNKIKDIDGTGKDFINQANPTGSFFIGQPYGVVYDYKIIGMYQLNEEIPAALASQGFKAGQYKIEDVDKDGIITVADKQILGRLDPDYSLGISNTLQYKNIQLKFFINTIQGGSNGYIAAPGANLQNPDNIRNNNGFDFDYWTPNNTDARYRSIAAYVPTLGERFSPYLSRSFIRLQDVTLTYNLSQKLLDRMKIIRAVSIYFNAQNLFTITDWDGWDPETGAGLDANGYPIMKNYSLGLNITF